MFYLRQYNNKNQDRASATICFRKWSDAMATAEIWKSQGFHVEIKDKGFWVEF